jgi:hypothetical protein
VGVEEEAMTSRRRTAALLALVVVAGPGCAKRERDAARSVVVADEKKEEIRKDEARKKTGLYGLKGPAGRAERVASAAPPAPRAARLAKQLAEPKAKEKDKGGGGGASEQGQQTRSWFPETFLFQPLVITDESGAASVEVRVPDRLTTWRVLALAHSRAGAQAGDETRFLGTLPVYVEPVVPPRLRSGDVVRLPITVVNTTGAPVKTTLKLAAAGVALRGPELRAVTVPATGSIVQHAELRAGAPGTARLIARLGGTDAVARTLEVVARGRAVSQVRGGTLAAPRKLAIERPADAEPALGRVRLEVFPGALALLRSELASSIERGGELADHGYALLLAGRAPALLNSLGDPLDDKGRSALRDASLVAMQRVLREARVLNVASASLLARAALAHPENPILARLGARAVAEIAAKQRPDGTCGGETGWTLQRLLVATADCVRAAESDRRVAVRASGAFERNAEAIRDPYTAAAALASGTVSDSQAARLRKLLLAAIERREDGAKVVVVPPGIVRADGVRPSAVEASALAILALRNERAGAPLADLGAAVVGGYSPARGWGDGRASLIAMQAVLELFRDPMPAQIRVTLARDGETVAEGTFDRRRLRELVVLEAEAGSASEAQRWTVSAVPPVAGLGFALTITDRVPWQKEERRGGVELEVKPPKALQVGRAAAVAVRATAPAGRPLAIELALPAGVQVDRRHLDQLVEGGGLVRYKAAAGQLELEAAPLAPAKPLAVEVRVIPTLAGTIWSGPSTVRVAGQELLIPPSAWTIR